MGSAIGVKDRVSCRVSTRMGHSDGARNQFGAHVVGHRPARNLPRAQIDHRRRIQPSLGRRQAGDVPDEFQTRQRRGEVPQDQIRRRRRRAVLSRQRSRLPSRYPDDLTLPHDPGDAPAVHHVTPIPEFRVIRRAP